MKIGILTQPLRYNYGGILQNYALQQILIKSGHEVITIDQKERVFVKNNIVMVLSVIKTIILKLLGRGQNRKYPETKRSEKIKARKILEFTDSKIYHTPTIKSSRNIINYINRGEFDAVVVGSDQVWRPGYNQDILLNFLNGLEKKSIKRLAYAASFGVDVWELSSKETKEAKRLIHLFDFVGVREKSGLVLCEKYLDYNKAQLVLDPTLLLEKQDYEMLLDKVQGNNDKYLLSYILNKTPISDAIINKVAKSNHMSIKSVAHGRDMYPSIEDWLSGFMNASFVVCDSFHAVAFSIIFNKDFLVLGNKGRGLSRFYSILSIFNLEDRLIVDADKIVSYKRIDWETVNSTRRILKEKSIKMLKQSLS